MLVAEMLAAVAEADKNEIMRLLLAVFFSLLKMHENSKKIYNFLLLILVIWYNSIR